MLQIDNVTCSDNYKDAATLGPVFGSNGGFLIVQTHDVWVELGYGRQGQWNWSQEVHIPAGYYDLGPGVVAVRCRNYTAGSNAIIGAALATAAEPKPFTAAGTGFGNATPGGSSGSVSEERRIAVNLTNPYVTADAGNSYPLIQSVTGANIGGWGYSQSVEGVVFGNVLVPSKYDNSFAASLVLAVGSAGGTGNVALKVGWVQLGSGSSFAAPAYTVEATQVQTLAVAQTMYYVTFTLSNTLTPNALMLVEVIRAGNLGSDTLANQLLLLGAWLDCTVTAP